jgi:hypothetical protein
MPVVKVELWGFSVTAANVTLPNIKLQTVLFLKIGLVRQD